MANREHLEILRGGAHEWNAWRQERPRLRPDLRQTRLAEADLRGYDLRGADLRGSSLLGANVSGADLRGADLSECDLRFCATKRARWSGANLREATGATERILAAAARAESRLTLPSIGAVKPVSAIAVLVLLVLLTEYVVPAQFGNARTPPPVVELAAVMSQAGLTAWAVEGVAISGGLMRLRLSADEVPEEAYLDTLVAACRALEARTLAEPVERIEVLRRSGDLGWVYEQAASCGDVLESSPKKLPFNVAAASRPIRAAPSAGDEN